MAKQIKEKKEYSELDNVDIFFVFGSKVKTAMCDWVYGMKIYSKLSVSLRDDLIREFQMDIKKNFQRFFGQSICATDIIFEKDY
jgi:hypothetical protein